MSLYPWPFLKCGLLPFRQLDVRLLEKMKLNCQVFKEEISMVHLNRQVAHLQNALQESCVKVLLIKLRLWTPFVDYLNSALFTEFNRRVESLEPSQWSLINSMWNTVAPICGKVVWSESETVLIAKNKQWETEICTKTTLVIERSMRGMILKSNFCWRENRVKFGVLATANVVFPSSLTILEQLVQYTQYNRPLPH